ncbi:thiamine biosynthesis lipoprotein [Ruegeria halocynthiae]|uniref:FAD:protein FMN transferase n=1 Tax=Ruegeria halocynthiae TaxID=985054 RepID=A0A1H3A831_9RHOB|nr:FAD:protein FMN transferase [Ruegeria halocynthiae]SDX25902.1 thiamine biosynthesis lipoprotein [Ruegeria halocynthiae]
MTLLTRRRFLTISAACAAVSARAAPASAQWAGIALGAPASLRLEGLSPTEAAPIFAAVEAELNRLEDVFSLYRPESEISRLNQTGILTSPDPELLNVLSLCSALHTASDGAFDPTVQPLWLALANGASQAEIDRVRHLIGWDEVSVDIDAIRLPHRGRSAITLNGIAQGAITDRIAALLRSFDLQDVLVDMGEIAALGRRNSGELWRIGLSGPDGTIAKRIRVQDRAVATSAPAGTILRGNQGHILNPQGKNPTHKAASVSAPQAALADGLSTALCLMPVSDATTMVSRFPGSQIEMLI